MGALIALLIVAVASLLVVRVGALALEMTGLGRDAAHFQAVSAFFGVGFTTRESEMVVNHPVRRRIVRDLIVVGNVGLTGALAAVVVTFFRVANAEEGFVRAGELAIGLALLWLVTRSRLVVRLIDATIRRALAQSGAARAMDFAQLLRVHAGFVVAEITLEPGSAIAGRTLGELELRSKHGIVVLGVERTGGEFLGAPDGRTALREGDTITVYGASRDVDAARTRAAATAGAHPPEAPAAPGE